MENPKSISPEILGLFGTIRQQAHEYNRAFEHFQKMRQVKARRIVNRSRLLGKMAHLKGVFQRQLRNAAVRFTPAAVNLREFEKLYSLNF